MILFHHSAGAQLLAAPAPSATAARRAASRRNAAQRLATQFQKEPCQPQHTPFKFPWRDQTQPWVTVSSLRHTTQRNTPRHCSAPRSTMLHNATNNRIATQRYALLLTSTQRNNHLGE